MSGELRAASGEFDVGAMFWPRQLEIVERHVAEARAQGASVLAGGQRNPRLSGLYFEPTVMTGVTHDMALMRDESVSEAEPDQDLLTRRYTDEAIRFIERSRDRLFFLFLSYSRQHKPAHLDRQVCQRMRNVRTIV